MHIGIGIQAILFILAENLRRGARGGVDGAKVSIQMQTGGIAVIGIDALFTGERNLRGRANHVGFANATVSNLGVLSGPACGPNTTGEIAAGSPGVVGTTIGRRLSRTAWRQPGGATCQANRLADGKVRAIRGRTH
jgi:hypothetical protein